MENTIKNPRYEEKEPPLTPREGEKIRMAERLKSIGLKVTQEKMDDYLRFFIFIVFIGLIYIWNSHLAEKQVIKEDKLKREIRDLRMHYISLESGLSEQKKPSVVTDSVRSKGLGLELLTTAPYQLEKEGE